MIDYGLGKMCPFSKGQTAAEIKQVWADGQIHPNGGQMMRVL